MECAVTCVVSSSCHLNLVKDDYFHKSVGYVLHLYSIVYGNMYLWVYMLLLIDFYRLFSILPGSAMICVILVAARNILLYLTYCVCHRLWVHACVCACACVRS